MSVNATSEFLSPDDARLLVGLCRAGKLYEIEKWIASGKSLRTPPQIKKTPLHVAMDLGFHSLIELLVRHEDSQAAKNGASRALNMFTFVFRLWWHRKRIVGGFPPAARCRGTLARARRRTTVRSPGGRTPDVGAGDDPVLPRPRRGRHHRRTVRRRLPRKSTNVASSVCGV